jgi:hypothetical protein
LPPFVLGTDASPSHRCQEFACQKVTAPALFDFRGGANTLYSDLTPRSKSNKITIDTVWLHAVKTFAWTYCARMDIMLHMGWDGFEVGML